jgi:type II secretory pathway pseudopilin PulG
MCTEKIFKTKKRLFPQFSIEDVTGFTLIEVILYVGVVSILIGVIASLTLGTIDNYRMAKVKDELSYSGGMVFDTFFQETKNADEISLSSSVLDSDSGILSLKTKFQVGDSDDPSRFVDLYLSNGQVLVKREGEDPYALTSESIVVDKLRFERSSFGKFEGVRLYLNLKDKVRTNEVFSISTFAVLRGGYTK